jgi:RNA polymerase sigma-70 factor (sigma-E family)
MLWDDRFADFVREQTDGLFRLAFTLTGDRHRAADLVQETLTRLYVKWDRVEASDAAVAYVRKAMVNQFLAETRRRMSGEVPHPVVPERSDEAAALAHADRRLELAGPLAELVASQRAAVTLHFLLDLADRDGARTMGCTVAAYRGHLRRGVDRLRTLMGTPTAAGTINEGWES